MYRSVSQVWADRVRPAPRERPEAKVVEPMRVLRSVDLPTPGLPKSMTLGLGGGADEEAGEEEGWVEIVLSMVVVDGGNSVGGDG